MGHLSFRIPDSTEAAIDSIADEEGVSRSEVARELLIDGAKLRTGAPVLVGDGGASLVSNVEAIRARDNYMIATLLLLVGMLYSQMVLDGPAQLVGMTLLALAGAGILVAQFWRQ
jgi:Ribbon-helix-helix protein, copG family.